MSVKFRIRLGFLILSISLAFLIIKCKKEVEIPELTTSEVTQIAATSAESGGNITSDGGGSISERGVCWSNSQEPTIDSSKASDGSIGIGSYKTNISGLTSKKTYYVRAYAINSAGVGYGKVVSFSTASNSVSTITNPVTDIETGSAMFHGTVNPCNNNVIASFEYGQTIQYGSNIMAEQNPFSGNKNLEISAKVENLSPGATYHVRTKKIDAIGGTEYGNDFIFKTLGEKPQASLTETSNMDSASITLNGLINPKYLATTVTFEYGVTTAYGASSLIKDAVNGTENQNVSVTLKGLPSQVVYHYRIKAENALGTTYTNDNTFLLQGAKPSVTNNYATEIKSVSAKLNCKANAHFFATAVYFEYGTTESYGQIIEVNNGLKVNHDSALSKTINGLTLNVTYHYRVKAVNSKGTTYSNDMTFTTKYAIGEYYFGGYIFYLDQTGAHGLVVAKENQADAWPGVTAWGCYDIKIEGTDTAVGTGAENTKKIIAECPSCVAALSYNLVLEGYDDWYLPSRDEMYLLNKNLYVLGIGNIGNENFWTSTQCDNDVWVFNFYYYGAASCSSKMNTCSIRSIRTF
jgi:hypothetical protein